MKRDDWSPKNLLRPLLTLPLLVVLLFTPALASETRCPDPQVDESSPASYQHAMKRAPRLLRAIDRNDLHSLRRYLSNGDDPNACGVGASLLAFAVAQGRMEAAKLLLQAGASPNQPLNSVGETPLINAIGNGQFEHALWLVDQGADVKTTLDGKLTALHLAIAAIDPPSPISSQLREQLDLVCALLMRGHGANVQTATGVTPLMLAVRRGQTLLVKLLLAYGADPALHDETGVTAQRIADLLPREDISILLSEATTPEQTDHLSLAQLIEQHRDADLAEALSHRTLRSIPPKTQQGLLVAAMLASNTSAIEQLATWGVNLDAVFEALEGFDFVPVTPLLFAIGNDLDKTVLRSLLKAGADPDKTVPAGPIASTPLLLSLTLQNLTTAETLLENGADPNKTDRDGMTPLMQIVVLSDGYDSARAKNFMVRLLEAGANVQAQEAVHGLTALHWAGMGGHNESVRLLLEQSADAKVRDKKNRTPLFYARERQAAEAISLLRLAMK